MPDTTRAVIYARISEDRSGAQAGVTRQLEDCRKLAANRGWEIVDELQDNDLSATKRTWSASEHRFVNLARPGYAALVDAIQAGTVDAVLAWHPDRLYRRITDLEALVDLIERNSVEVVTVRAGKVDLSTASGRLNARLLGSVAMYESEIKSERVARAAEQRAAAGRFSGGMRPYGYESDGVTIREAEAEHLRQAYSDVVNGLSMAEVTRRIAAAGATTTTGRAWTAQHLRQCMLSPRFAGLATHKGAIVADAVWPGLVDRDTWETARAVLSDPSRRTNTGSRPRHLLSGITVCGRDDCGKQCRVNTTGGKGRTRRKVYRCPSGHVIRAQQLLEDYVTEVTLTLLEREGVRRPAPEEEETRDADTRPARQLEALRDRLEGVAVDYAEGLLTREQFHAATATMRARIAELDAQLAASTRTSALAVLDAEDVRTSWAGLDLETRRAIMRELWRIELVPQPTGRPGVHADGVKLIPTWEAE